MLEELLRQLRVALNEILEISDAPNETTAEEALLKVGNIAAKALTL